MSAGSLRGIKAGAQVERVYFEVKYGDIVVPVETFDEAVEHGERLRREQPHFVMKATDLGKSLDELMSANQLWPASVQIWMRWVLLNTDGLSIDVVIDTFSLDGEH